MNEKIITVQEAKAILEEQTFQRKITRLNLAAAVGRVVTEDLYAPIDIPAFDQSSMDGYAFAFKDWVPGTSLKVTSRIQAGESSTNLLGPGEAARVFTGAPVPLGADTVVMQEKTMCNDGGLEISQPDLTQGDNFRRRGADIRKGELAIPENTAITAAAVGFLGALGFAEVPVFAVPSVAIVITGNELQQPGKELIYGQVYEASSAMLQACLSEMGIRNVTVFFTRDDLEETIKTLRHSLESFDVILVTGGVSVGDYDFVVKAAAQCDVERLFHKVKQRPGKPLYAGRKGNQPVFGLPGNPSSVLTCFYQYVWPLLRKIMGHPHTLKTFTVPLAAAYRKNNQLTHFLKGNYTEGKVTILSAQESYRLSSFATANCLVVLNETMRDYEKDEPVEINLLPVYG
jgi:molybdopterin molybdotransferase